MRTRALYCGVAAIAIAAVLATVPMRVQAQNVVAIDNDDIGGVVTGPNGPEAGVWVIAETRDLPTRYAKMVVTDDQGRYVVPDLPKAKYKVWVRGYGLVDSAKVDAEPGKQLNLTAVAAPNDAEAAQYYPAIYWYSMLKIPGQTSSAARSDIPDKITQVRVAHGDQEPGLRRLPPARSTRDAHDSGRARYVQVRRGGLGASHPVRPGRTADGEPDRRHLRQRAAEVFRRLDRPRGQGRTAARQAAAAVRASSATSSSRPGTGATRSSISTT